MSKLLFSSSRSGNNRQAKSMVAKGMGVADQAMGSVSGGQLDVGQLNGLSSSSSDGRGSQEATVQAIAVDSRGGDVVDGAGDQSVVAVLGLLQLNELGIGGCVSFNRLESCGLVLHRLLCHGGHS